MNLIIYYLNVTHKNIEEEIKDEDFHECSRVEKHSHKKQKKHVLERNEINEESEQC